MSLESSKKEYSINGTKNIYTKTLASIDIPEIKEDYIEQTIGYIDNDKIKSEIPCLKYRNTSYRITLDVSYTNTYNESLKSKINEMANNASTTAIDTFTSFRSSDFYLNPLEKLNEFNEYKRNDLEVTYSIKEEKITTNWQPYTYYTPLPY